MNYSILELDVELLENLIEVGYPIEKSKKSETYIKQILSLLSQNYSVSDAIQKDANRLLMLKILADQKK